MSSKLNAIDFHITAGSFLLSSENGVLTTSSCPDEFTVTGGSIINHSGCFNVSVRALASLVIGAEPGRPRLTLVGDYNCVITAAGSEDSTGAWRWS